MHLANSGTCIMAGDMNSVSGAQDADYTPVWSENGKKRPCSKSRTSWMTRAPGCVAPHTVQR